MPLSTLRPIDSWLGIDLYVASRARKLQRLYSEPVHTSMQGAVTRNAMEDIHNLPNSHHQQLGDVGSSLRVSNYSLENHFKLAAKSISKHDR